MAMDGPTGGRAWVEALYDAHGARVHAFFRYRVTDVALAEDLTADVFIRALERAASYAPAKGSERVWLFQIARNRLYDHLRFVRRHPIAPLEAAHAEPAALHQPEQALLDQETSRALQAALATLAPREIAITALYYAGGLTHAEIASVMRVSAKNVGVILTRARRKLRDKLQMEEYP